MSISSGDFRDWLETRRAQDDAQTTWDNYILSLGFELDMTVEPAARSYPGYDEIRQRIRGLREQNGGFDDGKK